MPRIADALERESHTVELEPGDFERLLERRERQHRNRRIRAGALGVVVALAMGLALVRSLTSGGIPADPVPPEPPGGRSLELTATIGGTVEVSSPRDWYLVDHWPATDSEIHPPSEAPLLLFEVANFDPGLAEPRLSRPSPGGHGPCPPDGIAVSVTLGPASDPHRTMCRGDRGSSNRDEHGDLASRTRSCWSPGQTRPIAIVRPPPRSWIRSSRPAPSRTTGTAEVTPPTSSRAGRTGPRRRRSRRARRTARSSSPYARSRAGTSSEETPSRSRARSRSRPPAGARAFGAVTDEVARVELHRAGIDEPFVAERFDLPPSLDAGFDAFVFEPQPEGGPYEVVAYRHRRRGPLLVAPAAHRHRAGRDRPRVRDDVGREALDGGGRLLGSAVRRARGDKHAGARANAGAAAARSSRRTKRRCPPSSSRKASRSSTRSTS